MAPITIALGPGFCASCDVDIVIETMRGHNLGRIIEKGYAKENTGIPGEIKGVSKERVIYSPISGTISNVKQIGDIVKKGETIAYIDNTEVKASIDGVLRGIIRDKSNIKSKLKIADIDPRKEEVKNSFTISDKARTIAGGVLEAILYMKQKHEDRIIMDEIILKEIYNQVKNGYKVALATITKTIGSTPGKMGATMAVFQNGNTIGSVGGGMIEHKVLNKCVECLKSGEDYNFEYSLNDNGNLGMQCGGTAFGYIKVFKPKPKLIIIGGGHIGLALFKIAKNLDFYTIVIDDREEFANEQRFENVDEVYSGDIPNIIKNISINDNTYIVIATRGYEGDLISLRSVIDRNPMYIGMIGSM